MTTTMDFKQLNRTAEENLMSKVRVNKMTKDWKERLKKINLCKCWRVCMTGHQDTYEQLEELIQSELDRQKKEIITSVLDLPRNPGDEDGNDQTIYLDDIIKELRSTK